MIDGGRVASGSFPWLKIALWWGIIADALATAGMCFPGLFTRVTGLRVAAGQGLSTGLLYGAPVMMGWTLLLLWAVQEPVARRGVMLCLLPVVASYATMDVVFMLRGMLSLPGSIPKLVLQLLFLCACILGYAQAVRTAARERR